MSKFYHTVEILVAVVLIMPFAVGAASMLLT